MICDDGDRVGVGPATVLWRSVGCKINIDTILQRQNKFKIVGNIEFDDKFHATTRRWKKNNQLVQLVIGEMKNI